MRPTPLPRWARRAFIGCVAAALLVASGIIGYRVLAPTETVDAADRPYPFHEVPASVRLAELRAAPLIIDDRLRVYAEKGRVWADAPISSPRELSPYWAYRRWPAQVVGVLAVEPTASADPVVVTRWSDGVVVALDARTGLVAWRMATDGDGGYTGRRTGAAAVYEPLGMYTARSATDGQPVLVITGNAEVFGYDPVTGARRWTVQRARCALAWTGETTFVAVTGGDGACSGLEIFDAGTGRLLGSWQSPGPSHRGWDDAMTPWGCTLGYSGCRMVQVLAGGSRSQWALGADGTVRPEPYARSTADLVLSDALVRAGADGYLGLIDRATGAERWSTRQSGVLVGADDRNVYLVTRRADLLVLDVARGYVTGRVDLAGMGGSTWKPGYVYFHDGYVAVERISRTGRPSDSDARYYYSAFPVVLAGI